MDTLNEQVRKLANAASRRPVIVAGPRGSGKVEIAKAAAAYMQPKLTPRMVYLGLLDVSGYPIMEIGRVKVSTSELQRVLMVPKYQPVIFHEFERNNMNAQAYDIICLSLMEFILLGDNPTFICVLDDSQIPSMLSERCSIFRMVASILKLPEA